MTEILETESTVSTYNSTVSVEFNTSPIYKMKEALSLTFQPPDILHREKEMVEQREILNDVFRHTRPQNTMCFGEAMLMKTVNQLPRKPLVKEHLLNPSRRRPLTSSLFFSDFHSPTQSPMHRFISGQSSWFNASQISICHAADTRTNERAYERTVGLG
ncbi:MAG: hypothetical protein WB643_12910 [Candidatus Bathyarchaeia archaeon]